MNIDRRTFLKHAGIGLAATYVTPSLVSCASESEVSAPILREIGIQLFTLREQLAQGALQTIGRVAAIGYDHVETFDPEISETGQVSFWGLPLSDLQLILDDNGLQTHSGHYDLSDFLSADNGDDELLKTYIETAALLGQKFLIAPVPPMMAIDRLNRDDYLFMAEQLNKGGELAAKSGIQIGYHNHFWEFRPFTNGTKGLDILIESTQPDLVVFELDLFWTEKSGVDSTKYFNQYPGRFPLWHIKDMDRENTAPVIGSELDTLSVMKILPHISYTEVGTGAIDFGRILADADTAGMKYAYVEQDVITIDPFTSVKQSHQYVRENLM